MSTTAMKMHYSLMASTFQGVDHFLMAHKFCCALQAQEMQKELNNMGLAVRQNKWAPAKEEHFHLLRNHRFSVVSSADRQSWDRISLMSPDKPLSDLKPGDTIQHQDYDRVKGRLGSCSLQMTVESVSDKGVAKFNRGAKWQLTVMPGARSLVYKTLVMHRYHLNDLGMLIPEKVLLGC